MPSRLPHRSTPSRRKLRRRSAEARNAQDRKPDKPKPKSMPRIRVKSGTHGRPGATTARRGPGRGGVHGHRQRFERPAMCTWCGVDYMAKQSTRLGLPTYCGGAHRTAAWRARRKDWDAYLQAWNNPVAPMRDTFLRIVAEKQRLEIPRVRAAYVMSLKPEVPAEAVRQVDTAEDVRVHGQDQFQMHILTPEERIRAMQDLEYAEWLRRQGKL